MVDLWFLRVCRLLLVRFHSWSPFADTREITAVFSRNWTREFISALKSVVTDPPSVNKFSYICLFVKHSTLNCKIQRLLTQASDWEIVLQHQYFRISCGTSFFHWLHYNRVAMVGKQHPTPPARSKATWCKHVVCIPEKTEVTFKAAGKLLLTCFKHLEQRNPVCAGLSQTSDSGTKRTTSVCAGTSFPWLQLRCALFLGLITSQTATL